MFLYWLLYEFATDGATTNLHDAMDKAVDQDQKVLLWPDVAGSRV